MGIIEKQVKDAFDRFKETGNLFEFVRKLVTDADYSVRYVWQMSDVLDAIKKHCPPSTFECVYYDGENGGIYHLLDFDPNGLKPESIRIEARSRLQHEIGVELDYLDKAMESVYLINTNVMVKFNT